MCSSDLAMREFLDSDDPCFILRGYAGTGKTTLVSRLLEVCFAESPAHGQVDDHVALVSVLRMACALEPYLRVYTAEIEPRHILEFLVFDEDFPRSIRFPASFSKARTNSFSFSSGFTIFRCTTFSLFSTNSSVGSSLSTTASASAFESFRCCTDGRLSP